MKSLRTYSAGGIVMCGDEILLVCENGNFWGFPKGRIEMNESILEAARREITEETGCQDFELVRELGTYNRHPFTLQNQSDTSELKEITMYLFTALSKKLHQHTELKTEGHWVAKQEVAQILTHPEDRTFYETVVL